MQVCHLFISPGHNFFGHHGQPAGAHPTVEVAQVECVAGRGLRGDRFFDFEENYKGQVTFFASEVFARMKSELRLPPDLTLAGTRRNIITAGTDLNTLAGVDFEIQGVRFTGVEECRPCAWMNQAFRDPRVETWLSGRGGLRARILTDGRLASA